jgi:NAD/NADP transhydrogenase alpha subunit
MPGAVRVGVPTEVKADEHRVALTPAGVRELTGRGHEVVVEAGAGAGTALSDAAYMAQGARIVSDPNDVFAASDLIVKVKEPQPRKSSASSRATSSSHICTSPPTRSSPKRSRPRERLASAMRRLRTVAAGCHCSHR